MITAYFCICFLFFKYTSCEEQTTKLLDNLLNNYDSHMRPNDEGKPTLVDIDIMVRSMGPISEIDMTYSMDCYFRQSWVDKRLAFKLDAINNETLAISVNTLKKLWKPDTYFHNGKHSYLHKIPSNNQFVRIHNDGRVLYSSRLTVKAACKMNLKNFPMDTQKCPLKIRSFGYTNKELIYRWNVARSIPIEIANDMKLSQFDIIDTTTSNQTDIAVVRKQKLFAIEEDLYINEYSMLEVRFHLKRHMGNFLIQVYGPCCLLVILSWVAFWLNREATADRVSLGITTFLTITFLGLENRADLPQVHYFTALDSFLFTSFTFIFASIVQFAFVHYHTKIGSGELYFMSDLQVDENESPDEWNRLKRKPKIVQFLHEMHDIRKNGKQQRPNRSSDPDTSNKEDDCDFVRTKLRPQLSLKRQRRRMKKLNSVSEIDKTSRKIFPILFLTINLIYWCFYLS